MYCTPISLYTGLSLLLLLPIDVRTIFAEVSVNVVTFQSRNTIRQRIPDAFHVFRAKYHQLRISKYPNIRTKVSDLGSLLPQHVLIQRTAAMLSPSINTFLPPNAGLEPAPTTNAYAVIAIPSSSRTLIERSLRRSLNRDFAFRCRSTASTTLFPSNTLSRLFPTHRTLAYACCREKVCSGEDEWFPNRANSTLIINR